MIMKASELLDEMMQQEQRDSVKFSFEWMAEKIVERQKYGKDTIITVVGERRNGKSNWVLKLITAYIKLKKKDNPNFKWSWKKNFPLTKKKALTAIEEAEEESFIDIDEGGDIVNKADTQTKWATEFRKLMNKIGKKRLLIIITLPDLSQLDIKILNMCLLLVLVPHRWKDVCAWAIILSRINDPMLHDKFMISKIRKEMEARRTHDMSSRLDGRMMIKRIKEGQESTIEVRYPRSLFLFYKRQKNFKLIHRFTRANLKFEERYIKNVKDKQLMAHMEEEGGYIDSELYNAERKKLDWILYRLKNQDKKAVKQMLMLSVDKDGNELMAESEIRTRIANIERKIKIREMNNGTGTDTSNGLHDLQVSG